MYADAQQARSYAYNRWAANAPAAADAALKARIAQAGVKVLTTTDASGGLPILRLEMDDFSHSFDSPGPKQASIVLRASLFRATS
jgi:cholesterol transport system auxiliary component